MSDIQRYTLNLYAPVMDEDHNGKYVKYDDHIAEVEKVRYNLEEDKQCLSEDIEKLQARIDELEALEKAYSRKWDWMQARIDELEKE